MANIAFGSKYFIFSKFSSIPKTSKIEQDRANLEKEHNEFITFSDSEELENFNTLSKYLESNEHKSLLSKIQKDKKTEEDKLKSYESQKKSKKFKDYFKFDASQKLKDHFAFEKSKELEDYLELEKLVNSKEFSNDKSKAEKTKAGEESKVKEFNTLKKSRGVKNYFKFKDSAKRKKFNSISDSNTLEKYKELEKYLQSGEFKKAKNSAEPKEFGNTKEGQKEKEFQSLKKSSDIKFYFKFRDSAKYKTFLTFEKSAELKKYNELNDYINSSEHKDKLSRSAKELDSLNSQLKDYQQKKKSSSIKTYYKFGNSQKYKDYQSFNKSKELADYLKLEEYLNSEEYKELIKTLEEQESGENQKIKEHADFKNSKKYKWYLELKGSDKFDELRKWEIVFEDDFSNGKLDREKWITRYLWGDKLMNDAYALEHDIAFPTDGKNIETGNTLKIITKNEKTEGKKWKLPFGFLPHEFNYTTGLVSTAKSHKQKYGKIEAKIKVNFAKPVNYNFWMASEKNLPHVDILKMSRKKTKFNVGNIYGDISGKSGPEKKNAEFSGLDISQDFFIYTLLWSKDKLTWKINNVIVNEQTQGVPKEDMYLVFSSSMTGKSDSSGLPASMEVDWVRCYQEA